MKKCFLLLALLASAARANLADIRSRDQLRVGISDNIYPFGYQDSSGQWQGLEVELAKALAQALLGDEAKLQLLPVASMDRVAMLKGGEADIMFSTFTQTPTRSRVVDFATPYLNISTGVISPETAPIQNLAELDGKTLIVASGTVGEKYFKEHHPNVKLLSTKSTASGFEALLAGQGAALLDDNVNLWGWAKQHPGYRVGISSLGTPEVIAPAINKGDAELLQWLNGSLKRFKEDGTLQNAYDKTLAPVFGPEEMKKIVP